jgi:SAM-dependent methyltransferase
LKDIKDPDLFLKEVCQIIKKDGLFIISTPRKPHGSPYHIIEFSLEEFKKILNKYFIIEEMYGQIYTDIFSLNSRKVDPFEYKKFNYIAICRKK